MHPFWTPIWLLKFGIAIFGGIYFWVTGSILMAVGFFLTAIIGITILAQVLYKLMQVVAPAVVYNWELNEARGLLSGGELNEVERKLNEIDFDSPDGL